MQCSLLFAALSFSWPARLWQNFIPEGYGLTRSGGMVKCLALSRIQSPLVVRSMQYYLTSL